MINKDNMQLRAPELSDLDWLYRWENETTLWYLSNTVAPFSRYTLEQYILSSQTDIYSARQLRLMIDINQNTKLHTIGAIDLFDFDPVNRRAGIGILIDSDARKQGHATKAIELLVDYCFDVLLLHQVWCNICADNQASIRLFEAQGFSVCGLKKEWINRKGEWLDEMTLQKMNQK